MNWLVSISGRGHTTVKDIERMIYLTQDVLQFCNNMKGYTNSKTRENRGAVKQSFYDILLTLASVACVCARAPACVCACVLVRACLHSYAHITT